MKYRMLALLLLVSMICAVSTLAQEPPAGCPESTSSRHDCSFTYDGLGILAWIGGTASLKGKSTYKDISATADVLDEVSAGITDPQCAPNLAKLTAAIQKDKNGCPGLDISGVQQIIDQASKQKLLCQKTSDSEGTTYDLYKLSRLQQYVIDQARDQNSSACK